MAVFDRSECVAINVARINHLDTLNLDLNEKSILETGAGGRGDITKYLLSKGGIVTSQDIRKSNLDQLSSRLPKDSKHEILVSDLNKLESLSNKVYDVVMELCII